MDNIRLIILGLAVLNFLALVVMAVKIAERLQDLDNRIHELTDEYEYQHDQATLFGTLAGLFNTLAEGADDEGLPIEVRRAIYAAGRSAIRQYRRNHNIRHNEE